MRKMPDCAKCEENELWLQHVTGGIYIRCYLCGWESPMIALPLTVEELSRAITAAVAAAQPAPVGDDAAGGK